MPSFGETLRRERESQSKTLEEMAAATGIGLSFLQALESEEIADLPGRAFGKLYIRAYAEVLGFDPRPVLEDYDRPRTLAQSTHAPGSSGESSTARPVGAALARWREARMAELQKARVEEPEDLDELDEAPEEAEHLEVETPVELGDVPGEHLEVRGPVELEVVVPRAVVPISASSSRSSLSLRGLLALGLVAGIAGAYFIFFRFFRSEAEPASTVAPTQETRQAPPPEPLPAPVEERPSAPSPAPRRAAPKTTTSPAHLTVSEFGVGRRIVGQRLEGKDERFRPGDRVVFATRVVGGRAGERIRHVWIHEGRTQQSIRLRLGGSSWRTHSSKTLGRAGDWAVEARDDEGRVLARAIFLCSP